MLRPVGKQVARPAFGSALRLGGPLPLLARFFCPWNRFRLRLAAEDSPSLKIVQ